MKRKLTEKARRAIRRSFYTQIDRKLLPIEQARVMADHACAILELDEEDTRDWWEQPPKKKNGA
jgi:hypothetical protein